MCIVVGHKWDKGAVYIGRGSPLGNPFAMKDKSDVERDRVCDEYERYMFEKIQSGDEVVLAELNRLHEVHKQRGSLVLGCFCAPKRCHGDFIKALLENIDE